MNLICLGHISYWAKLVQQPSLNLHTNHTFQKQSELSQYEIVTTSGKLKLSVPTQKKTRKGPYDRVQLDHSTRWQTEHWRSIQNAYLRSPFFLYYGYKIEEAYSRDFSRLFEFNLYTTQVVLDLLKINKPLQLITNKPVYYKDQPIQHIVEYPQVFDDKLPFMANVSILDLIFNLGPESKDYLESL